MTTRIIVGDCREVLPTLEAGSVHCVVTSPPYFGLRDYGHAGQIGLEPTPDEFVAALVDVFGHVRRVLRDDGVAWLNLGDSFSGGDNKRSGEGEERATPNGRFGGIDNSAMAQRRTVGTSMASPGSQLLIPHRVALALQADGWTLRQTVVWSKVAPMPESVAGTRWERCRSKLASKRARDSAADTERGNVRSNSSYTTGETQWADCPGCAKCATTDGYVLRRGSWRHTSATEYVFMLTRGMSYWADQEAVREANADSTEARAGIPRKKSTKDRQRAQGDKAGCGPVEYGTVLAPSYANPAGRNPRNWVTPSPSPFPGAHFATFPPSLIEPFIKATCPARCCPTCGAGWAPVVERENPPAERENWAGQSASKGGSSRPGGFYGGGETRGHRPTCACRLAPPVPGTVLDPFAGAGTTLLVADRLGMQGVGIEINPEYGSMAGDRVYDDGPLFASVTVDDADGSE